MKVKPVLIVLNYEMIKLLYDVIVIANVKKRFRRCLLLYELDSKYFMVLGGSVV